MGLKNKISVSVKINTMKKNICTLLILCVLSTTGFAQIVTYIKAIDKNGVVIEGESVNAAFPREIETLSFGQENNNCSTPGNTCVAKAGHFGFTLVMDKSVPVLRRSLFLGEKLTSMLVTITRPSPGGGGPGGRTKIYTVKLEEVTITTAADGNKDGATTLTSSFEVTASRIGWTYYIYNSGGGLTGLSKFGWDTVSNVEWTAF
jgi:type VI protein secretion system component Hcp